MKSGEIFQSFTTDTAALLQFHIRWILKDLLLFLTTDLVFSEFLQGHTHLCSHLLPCIYLLWSSSVCLSLICFWVLRMLNFLSSSMGTLFHLHKVISVISWIVWTMGVKREGIVCATPGLFSWSCIYFTIIIHHLFPKQSAPSWIKAYPWIYLVYKCKYCIPLLI